MATGAGLAAWEQTHGKKKAKCVLTSTGLLMEGVVRVATSCPIIPENFIAEDLCQKRLLDKN
jgi:hypothetical protein